MITTRGNRRIDLAWRPLMAQYLAARRRHEEADRVLNRVSRLAWKHLIERPGMTDERAYELAGIDMADKRMIRASIAERKALDQVKAALRGADYGTRLQAVGWALCDAIRPGKVANENRKGRAA